MVGCVAETILRFKMYCEIATRYIPVLEAAILRSVFGNELAFPS